MVEKTKTLEEIEDITIERYIPSEEVQVSIEKKLSKLLEIKLDQSIEIKQLANRYGKNVFINANISNIQINIDDIKRLVLPLIVRDIFDKMKKDLFRHISLTALEKFNLAMDNLGGRNIPLAARIVFLVKKRGIIDSNGRWIRDMKLVEIAEVLGISKRMAHYNLREYYPEECPRIGKGINDENKQIEE